MTSVIFSEHPDQDIHAFRNLTWNLSPNDMDTSWVWNMMSKNLVMHEGLSREWTLTPACKTEILQTSLLTCLAIWCGVFYICICSRIVAQTLEVLPEIKVDVSVLYRVRWFALYVERVFISCLKSSLSKKSVSQLKSSRFSKSVWMNQNRSDLFRKFV